MDPVLARLLWAALLGVAVSAVVGVLIAAMGKRRRHVQAAERHALLAQFRYALDDDPGSPVEEITARVTADGPGGVETFFALGSLLRRKGDYLRAIRLHEELIANARLHPSVRRAAAYELALDFRRAGMHGRAAETLDRLLGLEPEHREALRERREIAEEEGDWEGAIAAQERLVALVGGGGQILGHLHAAHARALLEAGRREEATLAVERGLGACEEIGPAEAGPIPSLALRARSAPSSDRSACGFAGEFVSQTLTPAPGAADALATRAVILAEAGDAAAAESALAVALDRCPDLAAVAPLTAVADPGAFLAARLAKHPQHPWLQLALARHLRRSGEVGAAAASLRELLRLHPDLAEARQELAGVLLAGHADAGGDLRPELGALLDGLGAPARPFACGRCGVELVTFTFRCPRCFAWDTVEAVPQGAAQCPEITPDRRTGS